MRLAHFSTSVALTLVLLIFPGMVGQSRAAEADFTSGSTGLVNVKDHGATGDGTTNDAPAIQAAIDAAPDGATILFPPGTYLINLDVEGLRIIGRKGLTLQGRGATLQRDAEGPGNSRIMTIRDCQDLSMLDLTIDINHIEKFGGIALYTSQRVRIERCRVFDSNLRETWTKFIRFSWIAQHCEDVWMRDCHAEDVELFVVDYCRQVWILNNTSIRARGTAIACLFVYSGSTGAYDYTIEGNTIVDPFTSSAIYVAVESSGQNDNVARRLRIANNRIIRNAPEARHGYGIMIGNVQGNDPTGSHFGEIVIEGNVFETAEGIERAAPDIFVQASRQNLPEQPPVFDGIRIVNNTMYRPKGAGPGIVAVHLTRSTITGNGVFGGNEGIDVRHSSKTIVSDNQVDVAGTAYSLNNSHGQNVWRNNVATGTTAETVFSSSELDPSDLVDRPHPPKGN